MQLANVCKPESTQPVELARKVQRVYECFDINGLSRLGSVYARDICFEDPIRGLQGLDALIEYFARLQQRVEQCRFKFHHSVVDDEGMFFSWTMLLKHRSIKHGQLIRVEGSSYLKHRDGKIYYHRDYFDLGAMVYENIPLLGPVVRHIRTGISER